MSRFLWQQHTIVVVAVFVFITIIIETATVAAVEYKSVSQMMTNNQNQTTQIIGADNFVNLYIWKNLNISSINDLMETSASLRLFSYSLEKETLRQLFMNYIPKVYSNDDVDSMMTSRNWLYVHPILGIVNTECLQGSIFENFDGLVDIPLEFVKRIRISRTHNGYRKKDTSQFINPSDFNIIPLFPVNFYLTNSTSQSSTAVQTTTALNEMISIIEQNLTISGMSCKQALLHDGRVIERAHGVVNFTEQQIELASLVYNVNLKHYNFSILNLLLSTNALPSNNQLYMSQQEIDSALWESSCHYCTTQSCVGENWAWYDTIDMIGLSTGFLFYLLLFLGRQVQSPTMKRRLAVPYIGPFLMMMCFLTNINAFNSGCVSLSGLANLYIPTVLLSIYTSTLIRFYYLKNLFSILKGSKYPKFHKILSSTWMGLSFTLILPFIYCCLAIAVIVPFFPTYDALTWSVVGNGILIVLIGGACILGVICFIYDVIIHRKGIREKGLSRFLFFEDPFYIRLDLATLSVIILLLGVLVIVFLLDSLAIAIVRFFMGAVAYGICGGNAMMVSLFHRIRNRKNSKVVAGAYSSTSSEEEHDFLENLIMGDVSIECYGLFKEYCEKELSEENIVLMEKLVDAKKNAQLLTSQFLKDVVKDHLENYSIYPVNISYSTKGSFQKLASSETVVNEKMDAFELLYNEILQNLRDTYSRFQYTKEFTEWLKIFTLQQKLSVVSAPTLGI